MALDGGNPGDPMEDLALATRAAWLYHAGGMTQSEVARLLGVPNVKAHRLIARAQRAGLVRVLVEGPIGGCIEAETELARRFGLRFCRVVPSVGETGLPLRALAAAAAAFLQGVLERGEHKVIGVGHGRTLAACADQLPRQPAPEVAFVSLLGSPPQRMRANPLDVIDRLADRTGAEAWLLPVPFLANTEADREVLLAQRGVAETLEMAARATLCLVGIGEVTREAFLHGNGAVSAAELASLRDVGAVGELLGHYFDARGRLLETELHERVIALPPSRLRGRGVIAVAGGPDKDNAILAVLRSRLLDGLITDEPTARRMLADQDVAEPRNGREQCTRKPGISPTPVSADASDDAS